jgi:hypothetical protein
MVERIGLLRKHLRSGTEIARYMLLGVVSRRQRSQRPVTKSSRLPRRPARIRKIKPLFCPAPIPLRPWRQLGCGVPHACNRMLGAKAPGRSGRLRGSGEPTVVSADIRSRRRPIMPFEALYSIGTDSIPGDKQVHVAVPAQLRQRKANRASFRVAD